MILMCCHLQKHTCLWHFNSDTPQQVLICQETQNPILVGEVFVVYEKQNCVTHIRLSSDWNTQNNREVQKLKNIKQHKASDHKYKTQVGNSSISSALLPEPHVKTVVIPWVWPMKQNSRSLFYINWKLIFIILKTYIFYWILDTWISQDVYQTFYICFAHQVGTKRTAVNNVFLRSVY